MNMMPADNFAARMRATAVLGAACWLGGIWGAAQHCATAQPWGLETRVANTGHYVTGAPFEDGLYEFEMVYTASIAAARGVDLAFLEDGSQRALMATREGRVLVFDLTHPTTTGASNVALSINFHPMLELSTEEEGA
jgi:hypothetical protein